MHIYIHIPYCDSKCFYCAFNSYTQFHNTIPFYMQALKKVILKSFLHEEKKIKTIFIGGGTPSCVDASFYKEIFALFAPFIDKKTEITTEANPNSASLNWLQGMRKLGVNRISFGVQSFHDKKLKLLNRAHTSSEAIKAIENAKKAGFSNISIDLLYDIKGIDSKKLLQKDIEIAFSLPINHISTYELTLEEGTKFFENPHIKAQKEEFNFFIKDTIEKRGFKQYEVSNYGKICKHNLAYWEYKEYFGFGAGAVGFTKGYRYYSHKDIKRFINDPFFQEREYLSKEEILTEKIFLGLRSIVGIKKEILPKTMQERANFLVHEKKLILQDGIYYNKDYFLADELALFIMQN